MPDFPFLDVFAPLGWIFLVLLAINAGLFVVLVVLREKWTSTGAGASEFGRG